MSELLQLTVEVSVTAQELRYAVIEVHPGVFGPFTDIVEVLARRSPLACGLPRPLPVNVALLLVYLWFLFSVHTAWSAFPQSGL